MGGKCRIVGGEEIRELTGQNVGRIIYVDIKIKNNYKRGIGGDIVWGHEIQSWGI